MAPPSGDAAHRGRLFRRSATAMRSPRSKTLRSAHLGKYCRGSLYVFSFVRRASRTDLPAANYTKP